MFGFLRKIFGSAQDRQIRKYFKIVEKINVWEQKFQALSDEQLRAASGGTDVYDAAGQGHGSGGVDAKAAGAGDGELATAVHRQ